MDKLTKTKLVTYLDRRLEVLGDYLNSTREGFKDHLITQGKVYEVQCLRHVILLTPTDDQPSPIADPTCSEEPGDDCCVEVS